MPRPPAPHQHADTSWRRFLPTQACTVLACDVFPADGAVTPTRSSVCFVLEVAAGSVHILGTTTHPDGAWSTHQARTLRMDPGDRAAEVRFLAGDRAGHCTTAGEAVVTTTESEVVTLPPGGPQANSAAERCVGTVSSEVTDRLLIVGEPHLRTVLKQYVSHHNRGRPQRAGHLLPPRPDRPIPHSSGAQVPRRPILGGLINEYEPAAA